jgi:hypothetical protein
MRGQGSLVKVTDPLAFLVLTEPGSGGSDPQTPAPLWGSVPPRWRSLCLSRTPPQRVWLETVGLLKPLAKPPLGGIALLFCGMGRCSP